MENLPEVIHINPVIPSVLDGVWEWPGFSIETMEIKINIDLQSLSTSEGDIQCVAIVPENKEWLRKSKKRKRKKTERN